MTTCDSCLAFDGCKKSKSDKLFLSNSDETRLRDDT